MRSSERQRALRLPARAPQRRRWARALAAAAIATLIAGATASPAHAQSTPPAAQGFDVERLSPAAPGGGWLVMDDLDVHGGLGGAMALTFGYAKDPLRIASGGPEPLAVVSDQAFADFGFAATYDRWRLSLDLRLPLVVQGQSGVAGGYAFSEPGLDPGAAPDRLSDARIGVDGRLLGEAGGPLRVGASAQLFVPSNTHCEDGTLRCEYDSDGTVRASLRVLAAGDVGILTYAGHLGVHVRPLDDAPVPGAPRGSELLFGAAAGARLPLGASRATLVVGPEVFGETAFASAFGADTTGLEALFTGRIETSPAMGPHLRFKVGAGAGLHADFGAPEWRALAGIEVLGQASREESVTR
jgi:hypothetical protein